jgi:hypothetical protein
LPSMKLRILLPVAALINVSTKALGIHPSVWLY